MQRTVTESSAEEGVYTVPLRASAQCVLLALNAASADTVRPLHSDHLLTLLALLLPLLLCTTTPQCRQAAQDSLARTAMRECALQKENADLKEVSEQLLSLLEQNQISV
jgi:hypothetical protein